ncbi:MAG: GT4 family glycosyltransferase PelF [Chlamydiae bacterium]|nr:GT4 family glycosyltransferase PelF [Chlamydiota bacterium]
MENRKKEIADICLICEGSYPYSLGGVAQWVHELINEHKERTFHIISLAPPNPELTLRYTLPSNVIGHTVYIVQDLPKGSYAGRTPPGTWEIIGPALKGIIQSKSFEEIGPLLGFFKEHKNILGQRILSESESAWNFMLKLYEEVIPSGPFKAYFGTILTLSTSLYSMILPEMPRARLYHSVCTGYAGFLLYRAKLEHNAPCFVTEHGIYTNERRLEIAIASWITETGSLDLALEDKKKTLKDFWLNAFCSLAYMCYKSCDEILTTYDGNREIQEEGGADPQKMHTIVHGINLGDYQGIKEKRKKHPKTVAFVGRIVPIKDVKTFIRACHIVKQKLPEVRLYALGPFDEDSEYYEECKKLISFLGLEDHLTFTGKVNVKEFLPEIDLIVLTSISEAQPLIMLEAGAIGIPSVASNVGACDQIINGRPDESPPLGQGGISTPLVNPEATAEAILQLLTDPTFYQSCSKNIESRIKSYYRFEQQHAEYRKLYDKYIPRSTSWQG